MSIFSDLEAVFGGLPMDIIEIICESLFEGLLKLAQTCKSIRTLCEESLWEKSFRKLWSVDPSQADHSEALNYFALRIADCPWELQGRLRYSPWRELHHVFLRRTRWSRALLNEISATDSFISYSVAFLSSSLPQLTRPFKTELIQLDCVEASQRHAFPCHKQVMTDLHRYHQAPGLACEQQHLILWWKFDDSRQCGGREFAHCQLKLFICERTATLFGRISWKETDRDYKPFPVVEWSDRGADNFLATRQATEGFVRLYHQLYGYVHQSLTRRNHCSDVGVCMTNPPNALHDTGLQFKLVEQPYMAARKRYAEEIDRSITVGCQRLCDDVMKATSFEQRTQICVWLHGFGAAAPVMEEPGRPKRRPLGNLRGELQRCVARLVRHVMYAEMIHVDIVRDIEDHGEEVEVFGDFNFASGASKMRGDDPSLAQSLMPCLDFKLLLKDFYTVHHVPRQFFSLRHLRLVWRLQSMLLVLLCAELQSRFGVSLRTVMDSAARRDVKNWMSDVKNDVTPPAQPSYDDVMKLFNVS